MKIFVASYFIPKPDTASGDRRFFAILQMLCTNNEVYLLLEESGGRNEDKPYLDQLEQIGVKKIVHGFRRMSWIMMTNKFDLGYFQFYNVADMLASKFRSFQSGVPVVVDSVDLNYLREAGAVKLEKMTTQVAEINKQKELAVYKKATGVIVVTAEDDLALSSELPGVKTWLIPNIIPILDRHFMPRKPVLLFVGGFKHEPNVGGILWFTDKIWPDIRLRMPEAELLIVGSYPPPEITALSGNHNIVVTGFVPDTAPYLDRAAVSIAPLLYGAGMKGKVSEALGAGLPVVTTSFGSQGFSAVPGRHLLVADDPVIFAEHVVTLLNDPAAAQKMGECGRDLVKSICSPEAVTEKINQMLHEILIFHKPSGLKHLFRCLRYCAGCAFRAGRKVFKQLAIVS